MAKIQKRRSNRANTKYTINLWLGFALVATVAITGIIVVNLSQASTQVSYKQQNEETYQRIRNDRDYYAKRGDAKAADDLATGSSLDAVEQNSKNDARVDKIDLTAPASITAAEVVQSGRRQNAPSNIEKHKIQREDEPKPKDYPTSSINPIQSFVESISKPNIAFAGAQNRQNAINIAYATLGKRYSDFGFGYNVPWCSLYISWVSFWSGQPINAWNPQQLYAYSGDVASIMYVNGRLRNRDGYQPQPGDFVFYSWYDGGLPYDHIGIVVSTTKGGINTIEGNTGHSSNLYSTVNTRSWPYNSPNILGYGSWF